MFRKLIKTADVDIAEQSYPVRYYEAQTLRGTRRYSSEVILGPGDRVILDGDSVNGLESKNRESRRGVGLQPHARDEIDSGGGLSHAGDDDRTRGGVRPVARPRRAVAVREQVPRRQGP